MKPSVQNLIDPRYVSIKSNQAADLIQNKIWLRSEIGQPKFDTFKNQATELARA